MNVSKVIKKILLEAAGISFEVRKWAEIIEKYVDDYVEVEKEKLKASQPKQEPQTKSPYGSWSYNDQEMYDSPTETNYTHFESEDGDIFSEKAMVYADELNINTDILEDFPNIKNAISGKLFVIEFNDEGGFYVETRGSNFPEEYRVAVDEMVEDHMTINGDFYTDDYDLVYASDVMDSQIDTGYSQYMKEDKNRWSGYNTYYTPQPKIDKIEINGNDFPEAYKDFKVDKWVITSSNRIEYDHSKSGYNEGGEYVVYLNMPMSAIGGSALVHEIKHAYDDWNRMSRGAPPLRDGWEIKNIYTADFEKLVLGGSFKLSPMLHPIIRYYYLGSKLESPAYLENEYDNSGLGGDYRGTAKKLMNFKASNYTDKKGRPAQGLQKSWDELIKNYDIPFFRKFKNVLDFIEYTEKYFNKRGRDIMKRIDKMRYVHDKPEPVYEPRKWEKPSTEKQNPNQLSLFNEPKNVNKVEIDSLEDYYIHNESDEFEKVYTVKNRGGNKMAKSFPSYKEAVDYLNTLKEDVNTQARESVNKVEVEKLDKQIDSLEDEWDKLWNEDQKKNKMDLEEIDAVIKSLVLKRDELEFDSPLPF